MPKKAKNTYMDIEISSDNTGSNKIFEVNAYIFTLVDTNLDLVIHNRMLL